MTTSTGTAATRRGRRHPVQAVVAALILLGVVASVVLVFSDSVEMLRVGVVVALWAALIGAMAMTKYRRESAVDRAKTRDLQTVYELQLEREISARREFEMAVEARVHREADAAELAALRAELTALRKDLERLFDGELPAERVALRADTRREIDGARVALDRRAPTPVLGNGGVAQLAGPGDAPVTAELSALDSEALDSEALDSGVLDSGLLDSGLLDSEVLDVETVEAVTELPEPAPGSRRSRRRNGNGAEPDGEHATGLSVAEIMAHLRAESAAEPVAARSRRRK